MNYDFAKPVEICPWCGYPFPAMQEFRHIKTIDCPEHMPGWFKHNEDLAIDRAIDADMDHAKHGL